MASVLLAYEPPDGGCAEHVRVIALGLTERGHHVEVAGPSESVIYADLEAKGIPVHPTSITGSTFATGADIVTSKQLRGLLRAGRFDVGHAHGMKAGMLLRMVGATRRVPIVYTAHCFAFISTAFRHPDHARLWRALALNTERGLGLLTARLICVSGFELDYANKLHVVPKSRRRLVYNGVDLDLSVAPDQDLLDWRGDGLLFGTLSTLYEIKGLQHVVEAAELLGDRIPELKLALVGNGPMEDQLVNAIQNKGLEDRIRVFPYGGRVEPHLLALDGFMLASYQFESLPIGIIEAMATGLPVIATTIGGIPEMVRPGQTGMLVPPANPPTLAEAIVGLASSAEQRKELGANAAKLVQEEFTLEVMLDRIEGLYGEVV